MTLTAAAVVSVQAALRAGLDPCAAHWVLPQSVTGPEFIAAVRRHRVPTHIVSMLDRLDLPSEVAHALADDDRTERLNTLRMVADMRRACRRLDGEGVRHLVVKGAALAQQLYGDCGARGYGDVDLLVHPSDAARAHAILCEAGWRPDWSWPVPGPSWGWRSFHKHHFAVPLAGVVPIDLHWHLHPVDHKLFPFDDMWERREEFLIGGTSVATLSRFDALAHSAGHAARDQFSWLRSLVDVHRLVSDPDTWSSAHRPLNSAERRAVGLTTLLLGTPAGAPLVVAQCTARAGRHLASVRARQRAQPVTSTSTLLPGAASLSLAARLMLGSTSLRSVLNTAWWLVIRPDLLSGPGRSTFAATVGPLLKRRGRVAARQWRSFRRARRE